MWRVSTCLELNGLSQPHKAMDPSYRERGRAVHSAAEALAHGYTPAVEPAHRGYVDGVALWYRKFEPTVVAIERRIVNRLKGLTGRLDLVAIIDGQVYIIDVKTGGEAVHHKWQVALYAILACDDDDLWALLQDAAGTTVLSQRQPHEIGRAVLYLSATGRPGWKVHRDPQDLYIARAALALVQIRHENGLLAYVDPEVPDDDAVVAQVEMQQPF